MQVPQILEPVWQPTSTCPDDTLGFSTFRSPLSIQGSPQNVYNLFNTRHGALIIPTHGALQWWNHASKGVLQVTHPALLQCVQQCDLLSWVLPLNHQRCLYVESAHTYKCSQFAQKSSLPRNCVVILTIRYCDSFHNHQNQVLKASSHN